MGDLILRLPELLLDYWRLCEFTIDELCTSVTEFPGQTGWWHFLGVSGDLCGGRVGAGAAWTGVEAGTVDTLQGVGPGHWRVRDRHAQYLSHFRHKGLTSFHQICQNFYYLPFTNQVSLMKSCVAHELKISNEMRRRNSLFGTRELPGVALVNISNREIFMWNSNTFMYISFKHWMFLYIWDTGGHSSVWGPRYVWCSDPPLYLPRCHLSY